MNIHGFFSATVAQLENGHLPQELFPNPAGFGNQGRAKIMITPETGVKFENVAGIDEAIDFFGMAISWPIPCHVWCIYLRLVDIYGFHVGKYTNPMDASWVMISGDAFCSTHNLAFKPCDKPSIDWWLDSRICSHRRSMRFNESRSIYEMTVFPPKVISVISPTTLRKSSPKTHKKKWLTP